MAVWSSEIKELEKIYESFKGRLPELEKELVQLIRSDDPNVILLYSRRCLEVIITDLCQCELKRPRKTEPLKGIIDKLHKEEKVPSNIITSMDHLNSLSAYGAHPKDFDPEQVKPVLNNLDIIIKWYLKYKGSGITDKQMVDAETHDAGFSKISEAEKSIAVLPFVDMSPGKDQDYFCDGITEEIINVLAHVEDFKVIARTSVFAFKNKQVDIREIGRMLNVEALLEGSVRKSGDHLRITTQLIKVSDGSHIWSERYDREMKDIFDIQDEISQAITDNLKVKLLNETKSKVAKRHSENPEAYNLYLKGNYFLKMYTHEGIIKASECYDQALRKDQDFALAYIGLANINGSSSFWGYVRPHEALSKVNEYINKALILDNTLGEAYWILGKVNFIYNWETEEAESNYKHALKIIPNSALVLADYSQFLAYLGRSEEAIYMVKRAQELDPLSGNVNTFAGTAYLYAGQYDKAIEEFKMTQAINPSFFFSYFQLGLVYLSDGKIEEALEEIKTAAGLSGGNPFITAWLISLYYKIGEKDKADGLFDGLMKKSDTVYVPATSFFLIHVFRGEESQALRWLENACTERDTFLVPLRKVLTLFPEGSKYINFLVSKGFDY